MQLFHRLAVLGAVLSGFLLVAVPAGAQKSSYPDSVIKPSNEPRVIAGQIQMALTEAKRALAGYEALGPDDPVDGPLQAITNSYVLMRSAIAGMAGVRSTKKFGDPVLDLAAKKTHEAWDKSRGPVDSIANAMPRMQYLERSRGQIIEVIGLLEQVVVIWP